MFVCGRKRLFQSIIFVAMLFVLTLLGDRAATAQSVYSWEFTGSTSDNRSVSASGEFTVVNGEITVITGGISGNVGVFEIRDVLPSPTYQNNDNLYSLTTRGVAFTAINTSTQTSDTWAFRAGSSGSYQMVHYQPFEEENPFSGEFETRYIDTTYLGTATFTADSPAAVPEINANSLSKTLLLLACLLVMWGVRNNRSWVSVRTIGTPVAA